MTVFPLPAAERLLLSPRRRRLSAGAHSTVMLPVFSLNLNQKVLAGRVAIGEFDGRRACIAAATNAEKVSANAQLGD